MNYYVFIYGISIVLSMVCGGLMFRKYRNPSGLFFLLFTCFASIWFLIYFLFFSGITDVRILLFLTRFGFGIGLGATYSLLFFVYFFDTKTSKIWSQKLFIIVIAYLLILALHTFTNLIVDRLVYVEADAVYREIQGKWYLLNAVLHITGILLFVWAASWQLKRQAYLNRIRLKRIMYSAYTFMISCLILQLILPTFGIWILEKEIIFFFAFFILYTYLVIKRYYFSSLGYGIGKIVIALSSVIFSIILLNTIKGIYAHINISAINNYWISQDAYSIIDTTLGIVLFVGIYHMFRKFFLGETANQDLKNEISKLKKNISYLTHFFDLERYLKMEMKRIFKTNFCEIRIFSTPDPKTETQKYFENNLTDKIFINDIVFIEEKKNKFNKEKLFQELPEESFLVLPIFDTDGNVNIGIFILGAKSFGDFYTIEEINILRDFVSFLELHLKYIKTYSLLQDLSVNLDKKVDEKTMEYNNLINKQKEFISLISHEIKSPIANAIFQADSLIDDIKDESFSRETIKQELELLSEELIKTGELATKLFSVQYFDTRSVTLFRERVQITRLLQMEYEVYSRMYGQVRFINLIDDTIGFVEIDKIQFQQVVTNLMQNAIKFLDKRDSVILFEAYKKRGFLHIIIEDNGRGFQGIDVENLFDRYSTGTGESIGLGMGLYLCRKIVDMHEGTIIASIGERLGGAKFSIKIPLNN